MRLGDLTEEKTAELLPNGDLILLGYRGSKAHGMFVPSTDPNSFDDIDLMGVYIAPIEHYLGFGRADSCDRFIGEWDVVSYELKKFIGLLYKNNPNVVSMLWLQPEDLFLETPLGTTLLASRELFSSKMAYHSFIGYAHGQLKRMTHLNQGAVSEISKRAHRLADQGIEIDESTGIAALPAGANIALVEEVRQYHELRSRYFSGYMGNKRKKLVEQHGFDTKNAAHLIRLLRMGIEFLQTGIMNVRRSDAEELLSIKQGAWTLEKIQEEAENLFVLAHDAKEKSPLPDEPDREKIEKLCCNMLRQHFKFDAK